MNATLIKKLDNGWPVYSLRRADGKMIATTRFPFDEPALMIAKNAGIELQKLSHENCDEIFGVINAQKLAIEHSESELSIYPETSSTLTESEVLRLRSLIQAHSYRGFEKGFNKAMELNKGKRFTSRDMLRAYMEGTNDGAEFESMMDYDSEDNAEAFEFEKKAENEFIQSLQQPKEIEVEVEMEVADLAFYENGERYPIEANIPERFKYKPKLDLEGCLILKKTNVSS